MKYCIWSTKTISEFMLHIPGKFMTILEVEQDALEPLYEYLKTQNYNNVYIEPEAKEIERYIFDSEQPVILQSLISKTPIQKVGKIYTVTLEKLIVDLFCDKNLFIAFQGAELVHIINNTYHRYSINFTKLFHYARRRGKETDLKSYLTTKTDIHKNIIHDKA